MRRSIPGLQRIMLLSALMRKDLRNAPVPLYRLLGIFEPKITAKSLKPEYIEGKLIEHRDILESAGYINWTVVLWERRMGFLFAQSEKRKPVDLMYGKVHGEIAPVTGWPITVALHDPEGDIPMPRISTARCRCIRARGPVRGHVYLHEIAGELYYRPYVPASLTPERLMEDMGTGRFRSTMAALERALRVLEQSGWVVAVRSPVNLPAMVLTAEGYEVARRLQEESER